MLKRFARFSPAVSEIGRYWHKPAAEKLTKYEWNSPGIVQLVATNLQTLSKEGLPKR